MIKVKIFQLILATLSILGWTLAVYALMVFGEARPEREVGSYLSRGETFRHYWDPMGARSKVPHVHYGGLFPGP